MKSQFSSCKKSKVISTLLMLSFSLGATFNAYAYDYYTTEKGIPTRWQESVIPYYINTDSFSDFNTEDMITAVKDSATTWSNLNMGYSFKYMGTTSSKTHTSDDNLNIIYFINDETEWENLTNWSDTGIDDPSLVQAQTFVWSYSETGEIAGFDMAVNDVQYLFTNSQEDISIDFKNMMTHELGHSLGLAHSDASEATMYSTSPVGETKKRDLDNDDISGINFLYKDGFNDKETEDDDDDKASGCSYQNSSYGSKDIFSNSFLGAVFASIVSVVFYKRKRQ